MTGVSYRCMPCSHLAELASLPTTFAKGTGAHGALSLALPPKSSERPLLFGGAAVIAAGGVLSIAAVFAIGLSVMALGSVMIGLGLARRSAK